jgi:hypothetical protein
MSTRRKAAPVESPQVAGGTTVDNVLSGIDPEDALGRFAFLFVALLALAFFYTFLELYNIHPWMDSILMTVSMGAGVYSLRGTRHPFKLTLAAIFPTVGLIWIYEFGNRTGVGIAGNLSIAAFHSIVAISILVLVTRAHRVTGDTLFGAVSVYLLFGIIWAHLFMALQLANPKAFSGDFGPDLLAGFIYYSFTTLTTLGLGDLQPISAQARALSILEVIFGNLYLAVLVSRLVALQISSTAQAGRDRG